MDCVVEGEVALLCFGLGPGLEVEVDRIDCHHKANVEAKVQQAKRSAGTRAWYIT